MGDESDKTTAGSSHEVSDPELELSKLADVREEDEDDEGLAGVEPDPVEVFTKVQERCRAAKIECTREDDFEGKPFLRLALPAGRETRTLVLRSSDAKALLAIPFESYRYLEGYEAICSYQENYIEAAVRQVGYPFNLRRLFGEFPRFGDDPEWPPRITLRGDGDPANVELELGPRSDAGKVLFAFGQVQPVSLILRGVTITTHDRARHLLEGYGNALFLEVDAKVGVSLQLNRERRREPPRRRTVQAGTVDDLVFPSNLYDREPMSLYWYARGANGMPLLQFLAYYQVIEFYFPIYAQQEIRRQVRNVVKDPGFSAHSDRDIGRLVDLLSATRGGNLWGDERSELLATLRTCLDANAIRDLISSERYGGCFERKVKRLTNTTLRMAASDDELVSRTAERIYEIRCKIVHTKDDRSHENLGLLLPFSPEADRLGPDIDLVEFVSRRVLAAAGRPLTSI